MLAIIQGTRAETASTDKSRDIIFADLLENYYQERLQLYPLEATYAGDIRYNDLLHNDISPAHRERLKAFYTRYLEALGRYDRDTLTEEENTSYDILQWVCKMNLAGLQYPQHLLPMDQFWSKHLTIGQFAGGTSAQPFQTKEDYDHWLKRVDAFIVWCDSAIQNMREGMEQGIVLPKSLSKKVIPQLANWIEGPAESHHFYLPVTRLPASIDSNDANDIKRRYKTMIEDRLIPAMTKLHAFFQNEYVPTGRETSGIGALPNGQAWYQHQIKFHTGTDMTAEEIFQLGQAEVARLQDEMEKVKKQVGYPGDLKAFCDHIRKKPELMPYDDPQQVLDRFHRIHETMKPNLAKLFDLRPKTAFEVRRTEAFREASASAEYSPGSLDGTRPGIFYVPIPDANSYNICSDEDLFLHEAIPGHHYQISLAQENKELPSFRRTLWHNAYGEGWALYCESLGKELGLYTDPYQYFGMLGAEMHRAVRLVVDVGLHAKGWTREQAIQYSLEHEALSEADIIREIERYMAGPGQALSYKVGQLKIRELRKRASEKLGDRFDIREFHNKVLESGCVPLQILEQKINRWIAGS